MKKAFVKRTKAHERYEKQLRKIVKKKKTIKKAFGKSTKALERYEQQLRIILKKKKTT